MFNSMSNRRIYIIVAVLMIIIAVFVFVILPSFNSANVSQPTTQPGSSTSISSPMKLAIKHYGRDVRRRIARDLNLTVEDIRMQLKVGATFSDIALSRGVSSNQLQTIIQNAFRRGLKPAVDEGIIKRSEVNELIKRYQTNQKDLEGFLD